MWIGVDVTHENELAALLARPWFRDYTYAPEELQTAASFGAERAHEFLTGRFAGKEAVLKVIGTGVGAGVTPRQVAILRAHGGAPQVRLSGAAARHARDRGIAGISVSVTHKKGVVVAVAIGVPAASHAGMEASEPSR
ncbi:4'-phosphopantetheinyl transferase superfamily protein [Streptomyces dangxiongensis]|uniref:4'-phosphopantetheinyl transferase superfamily protein n=1 Tax=Streptomyces dangxiongensis TaxID=1442032 RepID=A0A3G2JCT1_9ACTN|nr:4'-phosphopantetheinyl transferase superfamily protein [Streptomyces dangxiongensis]AYN40136.1 4'-phosphopantetheinyl transferase superfamily protein [Streptomyces dangxiongensis]